MPNNVADQFSDEEMSQVQRHGAAQLEGTKFSEEVEKHLERFQKQREANAAKMRAAQTSDLGPTEMEQQQANQTQALQQQAAQAGQLQAAQAQAQKVPMQPPRAPTGGVGESQPYPAQQKEAPEAPEGEEEE